jgi:hypothetical protein
MRDSHDAYATQLLAGLMSSCGATLGSGRKEKSGVRISTTCFMEGAAPLAGLGARSHNDDANGLL